MADDSEAGEQEEERERHEKRIRAWKLYKEEERRAEEGPGLAKRRCVGQKGLLGHACASHSEQVDCTG
jgi:hypothetical protein